MTKTFTERCHIAQQFLPDAQYKAMLTALHTEMLAKLAEQPAHTATYTCGACGVSMRMEQPAPAAQQEPVAWMQDSIELYVKDRPGASYTIPLYTTPQAQPAREWVGLTDEELDDLTAIYSGLPLHRAIEAKLRGKNHD